MSSKLAKKISPSGVFIKFNFICIIKKSNLLNKRSEKKTSFPYVNVELLLESWLEFRSDHKK